jgi:serine/threonine-protein kinase HipA
MKPILEIWVDDICAAEIKVTPSMGFTLAYTAAWLAYEKNYPFSLHLPLNNQTLAGAEVKNFFENLLPEGSILEVAASTHNLSKHDTFGLLAKIGRDVAGAMLIMPSPYVGEKNIDLRLLSKKEISTRIKERTHIPFSVWDNKVRLSIAGFQDKLAVFIDDKKQIYLPDGLASSTHIIKPENVNEKFPFMPANEYFCMRLARAFGLPVPNVELWHIPEAVYVVERYDRKKENENKVKRLHQIDLCQALNLNVEMKYQKAYTYSPEGATYKDLFEVTEHTIYPSKSKMEVIQWIVFNYLIGNTDAHAKNISFLLDHAGLRLAPFYDLVSGTIYGLKEMALFIGEEEEINLLTARDWVQLSQQVGFLNPRVFAIELRTQAKNWQKIKSSLLADVIYQPDERDFLNKLVANMDERALLMEQYAFDLQSLNSV